MRCFWQSQLRRAQTRRPPMAANKCIHPRSTPSRALTWTARGMAILLFAGCGTEEAPPTAGRFPGAVDSIKTVGGIKQVDYRDANSGARYQLRASLGTT